MYGMHQIKTDIPFHLFQLAIPLNFVSRCLRSRPTTTNLPRSERSAFQILNVLTSNRRQNAYLKTRPLNPASVHNHILRRESILLINHNHLPHHRRLIQRHFTHPSKQNRRRRRSESLPTLSRRHIPRMAPNLLPRL